MAARGCKLTIALHLAKIVTQKSEQYSNVHVSLSGNHGPIPRRLVINKKLYNKLISSFKLNGDQKSKVPSPSPPLGFSF